MNPESTLGIPIMLDVLLMVIIGGIGTLRERTARRRLPAPPPG